MRSPAIATAVLLASMLAAAPAFAQTTTTEPTQTTEPTESSGSPQPLPVFLRLSAYSGHAGEKVSVAAACDAESSPLTTQALRVTQPLAADAEGHQPWALFAESVIRDVREGSYPVSFHCGGDLVTVYFTVLDREKKASPSPGQTRDKKEAPSPGQTRTVPQGAPQTGDGSLAS